MTNFRNINQPNPLSMTLNKDELQMRQDLNKAVFNNPALTNPAFNIANTHINELGTQSFSPPPPDPTGLSIDSNAGDLLSLALQDAIFGRPEQNYLDMLKGTIGYSTPGGYGLDVGFNQPHPLIQGATEDWNVNFKFPFSL